MPVAKRGGYVTGLYTFTAINDILVDSGAYGVTDPFRAKV